MKLYAGSDLHSSNTYLGLKDADGKRVFKMKLPNDREAVLNTLNPYKNDTAAKNLRLRGASFSGRLEAIVRFL